MRLLTSIAVATAAGLSFSLSVAAQQSMQSASPTSDPCIGFRWDVSRERTLFASTPTALTAARNGASPPAVSLNRLYAVQLAPAGQVAFPVAPGRSAPAPGTFAGILALTTPADGSYRVAIDLPVWIDIIAGAKLVPAADYEGQRGCSAPHKIVEFTLDGRRDWILQVSGSSAATVRLTVTRAPSP